MNAKCELVQHLDSSMEFAESGIEECDIKEWPHSWPEGEITYRLNNFTNDIRMQRHQERAVTVALRMWQLRIDKLKFRRERNVDTGVDFNVSFAGHDRFRSKSVLAHAWFPGQGEISGDCEINVRS